MTLAEVLTRRVAPREGAVLVAAQVWGGAAGVVLANLVFGLAAVSVSGTDRTTAPHLLADVVVTMGCGDACPFYPGTRHEDWELTDPAGQDLEVVRGVRDEIRRRVEALLVSLEQA